MNDRQRIPVAPDPLPELRLPADVHELTLPDTQTGARAALQGARLAVETLSAVRREVPDRAAFAAKAMPFVEKTLSSLDRTAAELEGRATRTRTALDAKLAPNTADPVFGAMVSYWSNNKNAASGLMVAVQKGDRRTVQAILSVPPYLLGLDDSMVANIRTRAEQMFEPDLVADLAATGKALTKVKRAAEWIVTDLGKHLAPPDDVSKAAAALKKLEG